MLLALLERQHRARNLRALDELFARESRYLKTMSQLGKRKGADPDLRHKFRKAYRAHVGSEVPNEQRWTTEQYPGVDSVMSYSERMSTGYRWYHKQGDVAPAFWFGYGLSYTKFEIGDPRLLEEGSSHSIVADVANVGSRDGVEVVQLYVTWPSHSLGASEPPAQLRGYRRIRVSAGERSTVHFEVTSDMLRLWDESAGRWLVPAGTYTLYVSKDAGTLGRGITVAWP